MFGIIGKTIGIWFFVIPFVSSPVQHPHGYLLEEYITIVPRNKEEFKEQTKDKKCESDKGPKLFLTYVLNPFHNGTSLGCFPRKIVTTKKCLEYNYKNGNFIIIQESVGAPCDILTITPCNYEYESPDSYKIYECFEAYGRIPSPIESQEKINNLIQTVENLTKNWTDIVDKKDNKIENLVKENDKLKNSSCKGMFYFGIFCCSFFFLVFLFIVILYLIPVLIQKVKYGNKVNVHDLTKSRSILFEKLIFSCPSDICLENNQSGSADADPMINMDPSGFVCIRERSDISPESPEKKDSVELVKSRDTLDIGEVEIYE